MMIYASSKTIYISYDQLLSRPNSGWTKQLLFLFGRIIIYTLRHLGRARWNRRRSFERKIVDHLRHVWWLFLRWGRIGNSWKRRNNSNQLTFVRRKTTRDSSTKKLKLRERVIESRGQALKILDKKSCIQRKIANLSYPAQTNQSLQKNTKHEGPTPLWN